MMRFISMLAAASLGLFALPAFGQAVPPVGPTSTAEPPSVALPPSPAEAPAADPGPQPTSAPQPADAMAGTNTVTGAGAMSVAASAAAAVAVGAAAAAEPAAAVAAPAGSAAAAAAPAAAAPAAAPASTSAAPPPPPAAAATSATPPPEKDKRRRLLTSISLGGGSSNGNGYWVAGLLVGYELFGGLYADVQGQWWFGNSPSISKLAPGLTWYTPIPLLRPYIGAYYARWFVGGGNSDQDAIGGRAGITLLSPGRTMLTAGVSYEQAVSCSHNCSSWAPEAAFGVKF